MLVLIGSGAGATTSALANDEGPTGVTADDPSLHNPTLDNQDWYEFNDRYGNYLVGVWLPDDDNNLDDDIPADVRQDWRLWFEHETGLINADPEEGDDAFIHTQPSSVKMRLFEPTGRQSGGLYQPIYNTTPCFTYEFKMYVYSRIKESDDQTTALQVGIDRTGWALDPAHAPGVHSFPSTMVWSTPKTQTGRFVPLTVQAEAAANKITVFTYADVTGGGSHKIYWDTGSLREIAPTSIVDPENPPAPDNIYILPQTPSVGRTTATINWTTAVEAMGQVFYQAKPTSPEPPTSTLLLSHTVYLPLVQSSQQQEDWQSTALDTTMSFDHSMPLTGLRPDTTYEYFVASRGLSGAACETWVSEKKTFTTQP